MLDYLLSIILVVVLWGTWKFIKELPVDLTTEKEREEQDRIDSVDYVIKYTKEWEQVGSSNKPWGYYKTVRTLHPKTVKWED